MFETLVAITSILAGAVAAVVGFGVGSLLTPVLCLTFKTPLAVAIIAIPHFVATALRFWALRKQIDRKVFFHFGILSAIGSLIGAMLNTVFTPTSLTLIFSFILLFSGTMGLSGLSHKMRFHGVFVSIAGAVSGLLGGLVGNQGGIRSAALLSFSIPKESFIATTTAIGLVVDCARIPIYLLANKNDLIVNQSWILLILAGVTTGTFLGMHILKKIPELYFRKIVSALILLLGVFMFFRGVI